MSSRPWYKRFPADFIAGTLALSLEEKGAYSVCLDLIYDRGGPIPDDPQWVSRVCGCSVRKWKVIRETLVDAGKLIAEDGTLSNVRAEKTLENSAKESRKLSENGAKGGEKTREKNAAPSKNNGLGKKGPQKTYRQSRSQKPEARSQRVEKPAQGRGARLPDGFVVPEEWIDWGIAERPDVDIHREAGKFTDHFIAKPGQAGVKLDWFATWRNWIRSDYVKPDGKAARRNGLTAAVAHQMESGRTGDGDAGDGGGCAGRSTGERRTLFPQIVGAKPGSSAGDVPDPGRLGGQKRIVSGGA